MGLFDYIQIEDRFDTTLPGFDGDPTRLDWQTKTFKHPLMDVYKITMNGRLFKEDAHYESVPDEDRPSDSEEHGGCEEEWQQEWERKQKIHDGWTDTEYQGRLEFHHYSAEERYAYEATFTDGDLVEITRVERFGSH